MKRSRDELLFFLGVAAWVAVIGATWPRALSFADEVGYVGRARLLLEGHLSYVANSPGIWVATERGLVGKYPLFQSLLLAATGALAPRGMFLVAVAAAVTLAVTARAILKSWGKSPLWALVVLAHPTVVILARTTMADLGQAAAAVAAWWALRRGRRVATVAWLVVLVVLKPTGAVLALGIVAGEAASSAAGLRARDPATLRRLAWGVAGGVVGFVALVACNFASNGRAWFDYTHAATGGPPFELANIPVVTPAHATTLMLMPPLLFMGALPYWRRRELGPLVVSAGFLALMCVYFFVDVGVNRVETLVLAPRIILPVVAFLLVGYGAWLDDLLRRLRRRAEPSASPPAAAPVVPPALAALLVALPLGCALAVSARHRHYDRSMSMIREVASAAADARGARTLGVTANALKAGLLHNGPTTLFDPVENRTVAVFCSEVSPSHRASGREPPCRFPGYHTVAERDGFFALVRDDAGGDAL